jgi:hypothetical protein
MTYFKRIEWIGLVLAILLTAAAAPCLAAADDPEARAIMEAVDARDDGDRQTSDMEMILIDRHGNQRVRKISSFSMDRGEDVLRLMFFQHPADVRNTGFLTYDYDLSGKDDDQWLYLPALRKTKRIASADKSGSFMGSDLNYSDMTSRDLDDYDYSFYDPAKKEMTVDGQKTWVILSVPRTREIIDETGYRKSVLFVRQDNKVVIRTLNYEKKKGYAKYMQVLSLEQIEGIWVATSMQVTRKRGKQLVHQTLLHFNNVRFNQEMDEDLFTIRRLEKGL